MYEVIREYKAEMLTEENKTEILEVLEFLTVFASGFSEHLKGLHNNFSDALSLWVIKCEQFGWATKEIAKEIKCFTRAYRTSKKVTKPKLKLEDYRKFPQYERKPRRKKMPLESSIESIMEHGGDIVGSSGKDVTLKEFSLEERQKVIEDLTDIQAKYFDLFFNKGLSIEEVASELHKSISNVKNIHTILRSKFRGIEFSQILNPEIDKTIIWKGENQ